MSEALARNGWQACTSALRLDRWLGGELPPGEVEALEEHLAGCGRCAEAARSLRAGRGEELPPLRALTEASAPAWRAPSRARWRAGAAALGLGVALAAGVVLVLRPAPAPPGERLKGAGVGLAMWVQHEGEVRRAGPGEAVAPGDAIRFAVTTPVPAYVAVLSVDPLGHASVYYPAGPRAAPVDPGREVPLPLGTRLDATVGEERIWALFCPAPVDLEPLRAALEAGREEPAPPDGCRVSPWRFVKR